MAALHSLDTANRIDPMKTRRLIIYTDSRELIHILTRSVHAFAQRGWQGVSVSNLDVIKLMHAAMARRRVALKFVKAHTGEKDFFSKFNEKADWLAKRAIHR